MGFLLLLFLVEIVLSPAPLKAQITGSQDHSIIPVFAGPTALVAGIATPGWSAQEGGGMGRRCDSALLCPGEELVYEVSWLNISLGQIRLKTVESTIVDGQVQHNAIGYVDSYDGLPFVDLHAIDHTQMDDTLYSRGFSAIEKKGDRWQSDKSRYEPSSKLLIIEKAAHQGKR
ncbi:MAG TPA: hypothetical protein VGR15_10270, partial [Bacteroidota bacterium]|nr:hypothetical protein [Bacteroidota bacterium]